MQRSFLDWLAAAAIAATLLALNVVILEKVLHLSTPNLRIFNSSKNKFEDDSKHNTSFGAIINVMDYNNAVFTLTRGGTGDPFMVFAHDKYYLTFTGGKRVVLWRCDHILDFNKPKNLTVLWKPPEGTDHSASLWAPELHALSGRWYIYVSGTPQKGSKHHRQFVLGGPPEHKDPVDGPWEFLGKIRGMPDVWAIDGTVFYLDNQLYFAYSGRPRNKATKGRGMQSIFIFKMSDPMTASSAPVMISTPTYPWEFNKRIGTDEGPQFLSSPDGSWRGLAFSCGGAATPNYKMGTLKFLGGDPLKASSWEKSPEPLLKSNKDRPPYGPGHGNFVTSGDEVLSIFHATNSPTDGTSNRKARAQRVIFNEFGPYMGGFVGPMTDDLTVFTTGLKANTSFESKRGIHAMFHAPRKGVSEVLFDAMLDAPDESGTEDEDGRGRNEEQTDP